MKKLVLLFMTTLLALTSFVSSVSADTEVGTNAQEYLPPPGYNWVHSESYEGSNKAEVFINNNLPDYLAVVAGGYGGYYLTTKVASKAHSYVLGLISGKISDDVADKFPDDEVFYYEVHKYYDLEGAYFDLLYDVRIYSDPAKTDLVLHYYEIKPFLQNQ